MSKYLGFLTALVVGVFLWDHTESLVTVKGTVFHKDGMHAIIPSEVKPGGS